MSDVRETLKIWMKRAASMARGLGASMGGVEGTAVSLGAGILEGVSDLLETRTPEEVTQMIYEVVANPAKKIDLTDAEREVARILAARRAADAAAEETP